MIWCDMICYAMIWYLPSYHIYHQSMLWYELIRYCMIWHDIIGGCRRCCTCSGSPWWEGQGNRVQHTYNTCHLSIVCTGKTWFPLGCWKGWSRQGVPFCNAPRQRSARGRPILGAVCMHPLGTDCTWQKGLTGRRSSRCAMRGSRSSVRRSSGQGSLHNENGAGLLSECLGAFGFFLLHARGCLHTHWYCSPMLEATSTYLLTIFLPWCLSWNGLHHCRVCVFVYRHCATISYIE